MLYKLFTSGLIKMDIRLSADWKSYSVIRKMTLTIPLKKKTFRKHSSHFVGTPFLAMQAVFSQDRYLLAESHDYLKLTNK